jgi:hypothetical protein
MGLAAYSRFRATASAAALAVLVSACGGGGTGASPKSGGVLPQSSGGARPVVGLIRDSAKRMAGSEARMSAAARASHDVGSSNVATADPPVPRPRERPCVVQLFANDTFVDFSQHVFAYAPPAACPGPWAKVVFDGDFSVSAGRQFDRTASVWVAGTNVYFGTTAEPSHSFGPSWHVERDVTDLSAIFTKSSTGEIVLGNIVNGTYTGVISASGKLEFYPANDRSNGGENAGGQTNDGEHGSDNSAPRVPDAVFPLSSGPLGDNQYIHSPSEPLTATYTFPTNTEAAYLDVFLQSQGGDEFWYTCFPNDLAQKLNNCGNTAFREGEVAVDGRPAGVAPVYPWIYTGGIDPYLWRPIPGVETLDFKPYRVNLTPFAGILSDGHPHTITVTVYDNGNYFAANGTLLVYRDRGASTVTGAILSDGTSAMPNPAVSEGVTFDAQGNARGPISTTSTHPVTISGYVNTSHGRVETDVRQQITFSNVQQVVSTATQFQQNIKQDTAVQSDTITTSGDDRGRRVREQKDWPLTLDYSYTANPDGSASQTTSVIQGKNERIDAHGRGEESSFRSELSNVVTSSDTLNFAADGTYGPSNQKSSQRYTARASTGYCYNKTITSAGGVVTGSAGGGC